MMVPPVLLFTGTSSTVGVDEGGVDNSAAAAANEGEKIVSKEAMEARRKREAALEAEIGISFSSILHFVTHSLSFITTAGNRRICFPFPLVDVLCRR